MSSARSQSSSGSLPITNTSAANQASPGRPESRPEDARSPGEREPAAGADQARPREHGGREGPEPTRFGDWEKNGRCIDF